MSDSLSAGGMGRGRLLLLLAALFWSTSGLIVKSPPLAELPLDQRGPALACYRALTAAVCLLPFLRVRAIRWRPMLLPMVVSFAGMNALFIIAMTRTTAAAATFLQYTCTVWAFLFGMLILRERPDRGNLVALAAAVCGIAWIVAADWHGQYFTGNLIALASGFCYAGVILSLRALRDEDSAWLVLLNHAVAGLVLLPWILTLDVSLRADQWALAALLGAVQMALPYVLFARGVRSVTAQEASLLILIEPMLIPLWVWLFWGETVAMATWIGGGLILSGLAARYLFFPARPAVAERPATETVA